MVGVEISGRASNRRGGGLLVAAIASVGWAAPAAAQLSSLSGLPAAGPTGLTLVGRVETLYDSNVLRSAGPAVLNPSSHQDDFRYSPTANATYGRDTGRLALMVNGSIGHDFFQYNRYLDRGYYTGGGTITYRNGGGCQLVVDGNYSSRQNGIQNAGELPDDITGLPDDVGRVIDNVQTTSTYGASARCGSPSGRLSFGGSYSHASLGNAAAARRFSDSDSDTFSGDIGIGILRPGQFSITGSYSTIGYPNRAGGIGGIPLPPQLVGSGVVTYRIGVSFSRPIGTRLSGSVGASFLHVDPSGGAAPYSSPAYNVGLTYAASGRLNVSLTGSRDAIASTTAVASYRIVNTISLVGRYQLGRAIAINANAALNDNDYRQSIAIPGEPARQNQSTKTFGLGVTITPRPLYDIAFNVTQTIRTSDPTTFNYNSTRAGVTLAVHI